MFADIIENMQQLGFYDFLLPWLLFLSILYVVLLNAPFLQDREVDKKRVSLLIAAVLAFFIVNFPVNGLSFGAYLTELFGATGIYIAAGLVLMIMLGLFGVNISDLGPKKYVGWAILLGVIILFLYGGVAGVTVESEIVSVLLVLAVLIAAMYFISG